MKKLRQESREKDGEITKLKEARDQMLATIEELKEVIRQNETNSNNLQKQISGTFFHSFTLILSSSSIC